MGFAVWLDVASELVWAQGTHEYRPMGTAVVARADRFRPRDFQRDRQRPVSLDGNFAGFFGSLEEVNATLHTRLKWPLRATPAHLAGASARGRAELRRDEERRGLRHPDSPR